MGRPPALSRWTKRSAPAGDSGGRDSADDDEDVDPIVFVQSAFDQLSGALLRSQVERDGDYAIKAAKALDAARPRDDVCALLR
jgi:hypothetical protein